MRFANDPVRITDSKLLFGELHDVMPTTESPLNIQGALDFTDVGEYEAEYPYQAPRNFLLIDAQENARSEAFGKAGMSTSSEACRAHCLI